MLAPASSYAVVVLAGGTSRRMGGGDKTALELGAGRTVLGHLVSSLNTDVCVVVVGEHRALERSVTWALEEPPGAGPAAGLLAGVQAAIARAPVDWMAVLAGDQPFAADGLPMLLDGVQPGVDVVLGVDSRGRDQPLLALYRVTALGPLTSTGAAGRSVRSLLDGLAVSRVGLPERTTFDIDDPADLARARSMLD